MAITSTTDTAAAAATVRASGSTAVSNPSANLDKDGFLKMFVAQMQHQDPSSPQDPNESTAQMAQFSTLEQITNVASANQMSQSLGLLGRTVTYIDADRVVHTGVVEAVDTKGGTAKLTVDGVTDVDPVTVTQVSATPTQGVAAP